MGPARLGAPAERFLDDMAAATDVPGRFVAAAGMVRHLLTDPVLPDELLPAAGPVPRCESLPRFAAELVARRDDNHRTRWRRHMSDRGA